MMGLAPGIFSLIVLIGDTIYLHFSKGLRGQPEEGAGLNSARVQAQTTGVTCRQSKSIASRNPV